MVRLELKRLIFFALLFPFLVMAGCCGWVYDQAAWYCPFVVAVLCGIHVLDACRAIRECRERLFLAALKY
jgi:hypothetical protein